MTKGVGAVHELNALVECSEVEQETFQQFKDDMQTSSYAAPTKPLSKPPQTVIQTAFNSLRGRHGFTGEAMKQITTNKLED